MTEVSTLFTAGCVTPLAALASAAVIRTHGSTAAADPVGDPALSPDDEDPVPGADVR